MYGSGGKRLDGVSLSQPLLTISEEGLRQLSEESLEQAADHIEVLPALKRSRAVRTQVCSPRCPGAQVPMSPRPVLGAARPPTCPGLHACPEHNLDSR